MILIQQVIGKGHHFDISSIIEWYSKLIMVVHDGYDKVTIMNR